MGFFSAGLPRAFGMLPRGTYKRPRVLTYVNPSAFYKVGLEWVHLQPSFGKAALSEIIVAVVTALQVTQGKSPSRQQGQPPPALQAHGLGPLD